MDRQTDTETSFIRSTQTRQRKTNVKGSVAPSNVKGSVAPSNVKGSVAPSNAGVEHDT